MTLISTLQIPKSESFSTFAFTHLCRNSDRTTLRLHPPSRLPISYWRGTTSLSKHIEPPKFSAPRSTKIRSYSNTLLHETYPFHNAWLTANMCKLYQIEYTCLHVAKVEKAYCRVHRPEFCTMGITILTQRAPHKCHKCRTYDRDRWRRGWPPIPIPQPSLDQYMSSTRRSKRRPEGVEFEDDSDGDEDGGANWDGGDRDFGIEDEEEFQRTIMSLGGLRVDRIGVVGGGKVDGVKMEKEGTGGDEKGFKTKREGNEEGWTEHLDGKYGTSSSMALGEQGGIVLSGGLNGEDTGSSEGFGLAIDGAMNDDPLPPPPTPKPKFSSPTSTSSQFYTSPYSFSESRSGNGNTPPRTRRSPIRRKRIDSFATDHGGSEDETLAGDLGSRFGGYGGRKLRSKRAGALEAVGFPELSGGPPMERSDGGSVGVTMERTGGVAMERSGSGVPMERTFSHRGFGSSTATTNSKPRGARKSSYRGTEMVGGGAGLGLGMDMDMGSGFDTQHIEFSDKGIDQKEDEGGDLGLALGFTSGPSLGFGGVAMERDGTAWTIRSDDATRSYSVSSLSLPTRRRSTITKRPGIGSDLRLSPEKVTETVTEVDADTTNDTIPDFGGVAMEEDGTEIIMRSSDTTYSQSMSSVSLPTRRRSTVSTLGIGGDLETSATNMFGTVGEVDADATSDDTMESVTAQFLDF